ncbi:MAG: T9SS type A sorting domain-containing protein, partial [Polaribacter sp.]
LNTDYTININTSSNSSSLGFQLTAENGSNTKIGSFTAGSGSRTVNTNKAVTHSSPSSSGNWSFTWKSPSSDLGKVTFYTAVNASSGQGSFNNQDQVVTANTSSPSLSISEARRLDFDMYPNPASDKIQIQLSSEINEATVQFYDLVGRVALAKKITKSNEAIDVSNLTSGIYLLKIVSDGKVGSQKFIKN